ncbi:hypothetical protein BH09ACT8_BH09ACT8_52080 [soil metagenome]
MTWGTQRGNEVELRTYLLDESESFRALYGPMVPEALNVLAEKIDALRRGDHVGVYRYELPADHGWRAPEGGDACDRLLLTADDELILIEPVLAEVHAYRRAS